MALSAIMIVASSGQAKERCLGASVWDRLSSGQREVSAGCLQCHDGSIASNVTNLNHLGAKAIELIASPQHPVDVPYAAAYLRKPTRLHHPSLVDRRIALPGGKVHCLSCHDFSSKSPSMLVMPNRGSALCLSCHRL